MERNVNYRRKLDRRKCQSDCHERNLSGAGLIVWNNAGCGCNCGEYLDGLSLIWSKYYKKIDAILRADTSSIETLKERISVFRAGVEKNPSTKELIILMAVGFVGVGLSHYFADITMPVMKNHEEWLNNNRLSALNSDFLVGFICYFNWVDAFFHKVQSSRRIWSIKVGIRFHLHPGCYYRHENEHWRSIFESRIVSSGTYLDADTCYYIIDCSISDKSTFLFVAVGSQANIGGAASAPVVASAFSPSLAPVGVILAVLGYAVGTYGAIICAQIMAGM